MLESEAREALPYSFDSCTRPLGTIRQSVYACKTCVPLSPTSPPAFGETKAHGAAALCYSCSISCHGGHELVEIFDKRGLRCDCGTGRLPGVRCEIRKTQDEKVEDKAAFGQNFWGRFCACEILYEPAKEEGMMYQCMLGHVCQEDWFHDSCLAGLPPPTYTTDTREESDPASMTAAAPTRCKVTTDTASSAPDVCAPANEDEEADEGDDEDREQERRTASLGFPKDFEHVICWRCVGANPWLRRFTVLPGFFALTHKDPVATGEGAEPEPRQVQKRKAVDVANGSDTQPAIKRARPETDAAGETAAVDPAPATTAAEPSTPCSLPAAPTDLPQAFSLLLPDSFRSQLCRCATCFPLLKNHRVLLEEEETHEQPLSRSASPTGSIYDEGEKALGSMDRVRAIEGVLAYNKLKDRVKAFLEPFAKSGKVVGQEVVKSYFEGLRGEGK